MKKLKIKGLIAGLIVLCLNHYVSIAQPKSILDIQGLAGIWIAEPYLQSFDTSLSSIQSRDAFSGHDPVGLRINPDEIQNGILNIGFSTLHNHSLFPEISTYKVAGGDTIWEEGHFTVNLLEADSLGYRRNSSIYYFDYNWISYIKWETGADPRILLFRPEGKENTEKTITFKRFQKGFKPDYPYPNPAYAYTRFRTLVGDYYVQDGRSNLLASQLRISENGSMIGFEPFEGQVCYFSTDIYCGPRETEDLIMIFQIEKPSNPKDKLYLYVREDEETIALYDYSGDPEGGFRVRGNVVFRLLKRIK